MSLALDDSHRLGTFLVQDRQVWRDEEELQLLADLLSGGVVYDCRYEYAYQGFRYVILHPQFEFVRRGDLAREYFVAWQGTRLVFCAAPPESITFECPSKRQRESWAATMRRMQREHPGKNFIPVYP